ncbi:MAG: amino acid carrier protein, partial [Lachnospiraceae bacterium]|nr:amino acid carrier protein [Lachnospiraceae bacterium]
GGAGALFWMWMSAFLGMIIKQVEVTLGLYYRHKKPDGTTTGGPTYYMEYGLGQEKHWGKAWKIPAIIFGVGIFSTYFVTSSTLTASQVVAGAFNLGSVKIGSLTVEGIIIVAVVITIIDYIITDGGIEKIASLFSKLVPFMSILYLIMGIAMIFANMENVPSVFASIFHDAFTGRAAVGGFAGATVASMIRTGVARSVYSNEAGWGTSPMIHSSARTPHPVEQGIWGSFEVFFDTFIVCSITGISILLSGQWTNGTNGGTLAISAFQSSFGIVGSVLLSVIMVIFTCTTSGGWFTYYLSILGHMGRKDTKFNRALHKLFYAFRALPGLLWTIYLVKTNNQGFIWTVVDITSAVPTFVNVFTIVVLSGTYFKLLKDFKARKFGVGKVDPDMPLFYEDKVVKEGK